MPEKKKIQIGQTAKRDEHGNFLPAEPIYEDWSPELEEGEKSFYQILQRISADQCVSIFRDAKK